MPGQEISSRAISSAQTFITKFLLPTLWIPIFGGFVAAAWLSFMAPQTKLALTALWLVGALVFWRICAPLKRVRLEDGALAVSNYLQEIRVPLSEIEAVTEIRWINIHPVTIRLRHATEFGTRITFMPKVRPFLLWRSHPIVTELRELASGGIAGTKGR